MAKISYLECTKCGDHLNPCEPRTVCPKDGGALYVRYDLRPYIGKFTERTLLGRTSSMWRYAEVLPDVTPVSLGEGYTPMIQSHQSANIFIKDEGLNPTGSFKARGLSVAVTMCKAYGLTKVAIPSAGNAASALAAYAAAAEIDAHIFMPKDVPTANLIECQQYGATVTLVNGLISDCAAIVNNRKKAEGWFDISTLKEPYRVEGKKTMGYEVAEQLNWELPDAIVYPTGGGAGLIGMWKAFDEMEYLGRIGQVRPKMIAVQAAGCAPIYKAWQEQREVSDFWENAHTLASGLRVPKPYADYIILDIIRKSGGTVVSATDDEMIKAIYQWASGEGIFAAPEGAASLVGYQKLIATGFLKPSDRVVLFSTGSGLKYTDIVRDYYGSEPPKPFQHGQQSSDTERHVT